MKRFSEQFHKSAKSVTMQSIERDELRNRVQAYMEYHPLPLHMQRAVKASLEVVSPFHIFKLPTALASRVSMGVMAVFVVLVPFLAERSIPGDSLYAVKVRFNEEVISTLTLSPYKKVEWETERLNRRIAEARLLASEGKLTSEVEAEIAEAVRQHTDNVQEEIEELRESDADQAALATIELNTTLVMQSTALQAEGETALALAVAEVSSDNHTQMLVDVLNQSLSEQEAMASSSVPAYEKIMARVEENTTRAHELLRSLNVSPEDQLRADILRRLDDLGRSIEKANSQRTTNEENAREQLVDVLQRTQKLIVFMTAINVGTTGDLNAAVPIILTEEEQTARLEELQGKIIRLSQGLTVASPNMSPELAERVDYSLDIVEQNQTAIAVSSDVVNSVHLAEASLATLEDTLQLVWAEGVSVSAPEVLETPEVLNDVATSTEATIIEEPVTE